MLTIEVKRHPEGEGYFTPWIQYPASPDGSGTHCVFHLHWDDVTERGVPALHDAFAELARRWHPRPAGAPRGPIIPVTMELKDHMPLGVSIAIDDHAYGIVYMVGSGLLSERGAVGLGGAQTAISPGWMRYPARHWDMGTV